ncbi:MAG: hypothetical protein K8I29_14120 [Alphaproteobacteria bacterium]|uniref:Uncharacterized protein n=1 Tax=Candidatus Nitrobium versatile TaxID=2884831 RepID=A0A953JA29_9BACT|nr:hypothetical protein [Candidatus Nitrobium versatile]
MLLMDLLFAFLIAMIVTVLFSMLFRRISTWASLLSFFFIVFLTTWAGGVWITPAGPSLWGVYWLPFVVVALVTAFILAAAAPICPPDTREMAARSVAKQSNTAEIFGLFFWILLVALGITIIVRYIKALV